MNRSFLFLALLGCGDQESGTQDASIVNCNRLGIVLDIIAPPVAAKSADLPIRGTLEAPGYVTPFGVTVGVRDAGDVLTRPSIPAVLTFETWSANVPVASLAPFKDAEIIAYATLNCGDTLISSASIELFSAPTLMPATLSVTQAGEYRLDLATDDSRTVCRATPAAHVHASCDDGRDISMTSSSCQTSINVTFDQVPPGESVTVSCHDRLGQTATATLSVPDPQASGSGGT